MSQIILLTPRRVKHICIANARAARSSEPAKPERGTIPSNDGHSENNVRWGGSRVRDAGESSYSEMLGGQPGAEAQQHRAGGDVEGAADPAAASGQGVLGD